MSESDLEQALEHIQNQRPHQALKHVDKDEYMNLYAEIERVAYAYDALNNYEDRLIDDLAKLIHEEDSSTTNGDRDE